MIVIYRPADGDEQHYDTDDLLTSEAAIIERTTEMEWSQIEAALRRQSPEPLRAVAWILRKRAEPTLRFSEFDPRRKELCARFASEEIHDFLDLIDRSPFTDAERDQALQEIVALAVDPEAARQAIAAHQAPKAPAAVPDTDASPTDG